jgi:hypothetical protein
MIQQEIVCDVTMKQKHTSCLSHHNETGLVLSTFELKTQYLEVNPQLCQKRPNDRILVMLRTVANEIVGITTTTNIQLLIQSVRPVRL